MRVAPELDVNTRCELFNSLDQHAVRVVPRPAQHTTRVECNAQKQHAPCVANNTQVCQNNFHPRVLGRDEHATCVLNLADR